MLTSSIYIILYTALRPGGPLILVIRTTVQTATFLMVGLFLLTGFNRLTSTGRGIPLLKVFSFHSQLKEVFCGVCLRIDSVIGCTDCKAL